MATFAAEHELQKAGADAPQPVGLAVVGAGYWGPNIVRNTLQCPDTRLISVCDADVARAEKLAGSFSGVRTTDDLHDLLSNPEVEAIAVVTPPGTHLQVAMAAIEAGKHVLVEKPLAATYAEGRALVRAAEEKEEQARNAERAAAAKEAASEPAPTPTVEPDVKSSEEWSWQSSGDDAERQDR